jgi:hypothetical protein
MEEFLNQFTYDSPVDASNIGFSESSTNWSLTNGT